MRVAGELPMPIQTAEEEPEHDLPDTVALGLRALLQLLEPDPLARTRSRAPARARGSSATSGTAMNGWPRKMRASALLILRPRAHSRAPRRSARGSPFAIAFASIPGVIRLSRRMIMSRFCMSARTAAATPGYWTLTATSRPSCNVARYTCPIDAAAIGSSSKDANTSATALPGPPRSPAASA